MTRLISLLIGIIMMFIFGCSTVQPQKYDFQSTRVFDKNYNDVWEAIIASFAETNTPIKSIEKESGIIASEDMKVLFNFDGINYSSDLCDCGRPSGINLYKHMFGRYNVFAMKITDDQTSVQVNAKFKASLYKGYDFIDWVSCSSKGLLEKNLLEKLESRLKINGR